MKTVKRQSKTRQSISCNNIRKQEISVFEKTINAFKDRDINALENLYHEGFIYGSDYLFSNRADDLVELKEYIQDTDWHHEMRCVHGDAFFKKKAVLHNLRQ